MTRNDELALNILTKILTLDPHDQSAAEQLAELKKHIPEPTRPKIAASDKNKSLTKDLFRKLRQCIISHDDKGAYNVVVDILKIDPQNKDAELQRKELGMRLATQAAAPLKQLVEQGDKPALAKLVATLREYADDSFLNSISDFSAAAHIVDSEKRRENRRELAEDFDALLQLKNDEAREKAARRFEQKAINFNISLEKHQKRELESIHAVWQEILRIRRLKEMLEEQNVAYAACCDELRRTRNYIAAAPILESCRVALQELLELPEAEALLRTVEKRQERIKALIVSAQRARVAKRMVKILSIVALCGVAMVLLYAYSSVTEMNARLVQLRREKQPQQTEELLNAPTMGVSCRFSSELAATVKTSRAWVRDWRNSRASYVAELKKLKDAVQRRDCEHLTALLTQLVKVEEMGAMLANEFNTPPSNEQNMQLADIKTGMQSLVNAALDRYCNVSNSTPLPQLRDMYEEYKLMRGPFAVEEKKQQQICGAFLRVLNNRWNTNAGPKEIERYIKEFDEVAVDMELSPDFRATLVGILEDYKAAAKLPACRSITDYASVILAHPQMTTRLAANGCDSKQIKEVAELVLQSGADLAAERTLISMKQSGKIGGVSDAVIEGMIGSRQYLDALLSVYSKGDSLYLGKGQPSALNTIIDDMTKTPKAAVWGDGYGMVQDYQHSKVYVGRVTPVIGETGKYNVVLSREDGTPGERLTNIVTKRPPVMKMRLQDMRKKCGMQRVDLQRGLHTPAELMEKICALTDEDGPVYARVHLFDLAVSMAEKLPDAFVAGYAFSPTMRKDMKSFKDLKQNRVFRAGCWLKGMSLTDVQKWSDFFISCRNHNYTAEIRENLGAVLAKRLEYAGYVNERGEVKYVPSASSKDLYYVKEGVLKPFAVENAVPFMPLFNIH